MICMVRLQVDWMLYNFLNEEKLVTCDMLLTIRHVVHLNLERKSISSVIFKLSCKDCTNHVLVIPFSIFFYFLICWRWMNQSGNFECFEFIIGWQQTNGIIKSAQVLLQSTQTQLAADSTTRRHVCMCMSEINTNTCRHNGLYIDLYKKFRFWTEKKIIVFNEAFYLLIDFGNEFFFVAMSWFCVKFQS